MLATLTADPHAAARIRARLDAAGYRGDRIDELIGRDLTALGQRAVPVVLRRTRGGTPLDTLVRLFQAGVGVPRAAADDALEGDTAHWLASGLLNVDGDTVRATVQLGCHGDLLVATDWGPATPNVATPPDYVMGFSPSTLTLARLTVRTDPHPAAAGTPAPAGAGAPRILDLGTGSGLQALLAAQHDARARVVATDLNPRAVRIARFNAALNGMHERIDCRHGDLFAPLGDTEVFDSIVSNPPFVVGPPSEHLFMSAKGGVCESIARRAPRHLEPGGWCQFLANWPVRATEDWHEHLHTWFTGNGCDVWVIRRERQPVDEYAALWVETHTGDSEEYARTFDAWMGWYDARGITHVDYGLATMRRRGDGNATGRVRLDDVRGGWDQATGDAIREAFDRHDWLDRTDDHALRHARLRAAETLRLRRELVAVRGEWVPVGALLRVEGGIDDAGGIDPHGERIVAACDGATPVRALIAGLPEQPALQAIRRLVERGALLP